MKKNSGQKSRATVPLMQDTYYRYLISLAATPYLYVVYISRLQQIFP